MSYVLLCVLGLASLSINCLAQSNDVAKCRAIADQAKRLKCYDDLSSDSSSAVESQKSKANTASQDSMDDIEKRARALMLKSKDEVRKIEKPKSNLKDKAWEEKEPAENSFGAEQLKNKDSEEQQVLSSSISDIKEDFRKLKTITLSNGQVWRQVESLRFKIKSGDKISIEKGVFGAYYMSQENLNSKIRVKRIK